MVVKKVGIMSMQRIFNYGSFLQAYGLKKILEELGAQVVFVDFHIEQPLIQKYNEKRFLTLEKIIDIFRTEVSLKEKIQFIIYKLKFKRKYLKQLGVKEDKNFTPKLDVLIIGSDEVFNCVQSNPNVGYSKELFGYNNNAKKLISYAGSFGNTTLKKLEKFEIKKEISELLQKFDSLSVRDVNSGRIVSTLTDIQPTYNLDPVLIYNFMDKCLISPKKKQKKYMILYAYSGRISEKEGKWIKKFARENGLQIYAIGGIQKCADKFVSCAPLEVIAYFNNAKYVVTDTFHGTIFSIITHRKFISLIRKSSGDSYGNEEKLSDLLKKMNLTERIVYDIDKALVVLDKRIDYKRVDEVIAIERKKALMYLEKNI